MKKQDKYDEWDRNDRYHPKSMKALDQVNQNKTKHRKAFIEQMFEDYEEDEQYLYEVSTK